MKAIDNRTSVKSPADTALPRSIGVMIAAIGALLCWGVVIGIAQALS